MMTEPLHFFDPEHAIAHIRANDEALARIIDAVGPFAMRYDRTASLFAALAEAIIRQQLSGKVATIIHGRVLALFPDVTIPAPEHLLTLADETLRGAGLSRSKLLSLRDLAQKAVSGELPDLAEIQAMENEAIIESLVRVRGIGRWTAEMLLMFRLGRPDVLPLDDLGIRKGFAIAFGTGELPGKKVMEERGALWAPYRSVASWYLWRATEL